jgi:hypothetical protein
VTGPEFTFTGEKRDSLRHSMRQYPVRSCQSFKKGELFRNILTVAFQSKIPSEEECGLQTKRMWDPHELSPMFQLRPFPHAGPLQSAGTRSFPCLSINPQPAIEVRASPLVLPKHPTPSGFWKGPHKLFDSLGWRVPTSAPQACHLHPQEDKTK